MARLISVPYLASVVVVSEAGEIDALLDHPALERLFERKGRLLNRMIVAGLDRRFCLRGAVLPAFRPKGDAQRATGQATLAQRLDSIARTGEFPAIPLEQITRHVATGQERREAEAALAFLVAWPFMRGGFQDGVRDDAYLSLGRHLWRLHKRIARTRRTFSASGLILRLVGADRRARETMLGLLGDDLYGLHAVEVTLANADEIMQRMRDVVASLPAGRCLSVRDLAWGSIRTAPERIVRQSGDGHLTLPHVARRLPPRTLVLFHMRRALDGDQAAGYEFAASHWSACPAERFVIGLFSAVASLVVDRVRGEGR